MASITNLSATRDKLTAPTGHTNHVNLKLSTASALWLFDHLAAHRQSCSHALSETRMKQGKRKGKEIELRKVSRVLAELNQSATDLLLHI